MSGIPGLFSNLWGELLLDMDCDSIEADPSADPTDKEICRSLKDFNERMKEFKAPKGQDKAPQGDEESPLKEFVRKPWPWPRRQTPWHPSESQGDTDLDGQVEADPSFLDKYMKGEKPQKHDHASSEPFTHSRSSAYSSVVTTWKPDGSYEEKRVDRDADGNEQVTITYSDGRTTRKEVLRKGRDGATMSESTTTEEAPRLFDKISDWLSSWIK